MSDVRVPLAQALFALTAALAVVQVVVLLQGDAPLLSAENVDDGFPLVTIATVVASAVGLLIVSRYPRHRIGWLFLVGQAGTALGLVTQSYAFVALTEGIGSPALARWTMWVALQFGGMFAMTLVALLLLLAPDGRLLSPRWRWAVRLVLVAIVVHNGAALAVRPSRLTAEATAPGTPAIVPILTLGAGILIVVGLGCGAVSLVKRLRRATGVERAQLHWIATAATALALSLPAGALLSVFFRVPAWAATAPLMAAYLALPVCTGVAILRWRLYEIDVFLNRSIVLALLTGFVALGYVAVVVVLAELARDRAAWPSLLATAVVALAFQPARRRAAQLADRLVYGTRAAPYEALAGFNDELRHSRSLDDLLPRTAEAAAQLLDAERVRVWIELSRGAVTAAEWPEPAGTRPSSGQGDDVVAVSHRGEHLGGLSVTLPRGRRLRRSERRLREDLVAQLGAAFRAVQLEEELARKVELLGRQGQELAQSRARLVSAQAEERHRFEVAVADRVLPFVSPLPGRLRDLERRAATTRRWPGAEVDQLIGDVNQGLEALRSLTRGVYPTQLTRRGLASALCSHLDQASVPHVLDVAPAADGRFRPQLEAAAYFCAAELVRSFDGPVRMTLAVDAHELVLTVAGRSDGLPSAPRSLVDRVDALGGTISCLPDAPSLVCEIRLPLEPDVSPEPRPERTAAPVG